MKNGFAQHMLPVLLGVVLTILMTPRLANANGVTCRFGGYCLNPIAYFDWQHNFGPPFSDIPNDSFIESGHGFVETGMVHFEGGGDGQRRNEGNGWQGNFTRFEHLLWTNGQGPLTFSCFGPMIGIGAQIQAHSEGPFTALIQAFDGGGNLIDSFSETGNSNGNEDGSAIYIGLDNEFETFSQVTFSLTDATGDLNDFAINQLDILPWSDAPGPAEPMSLVLMGSGLFSVAAVARKRWAKRS